MVRQAAQGDPYIAAFPTGLNLNEEGQVINARINEVSAPSKIVLEPLVAPTPQTISMSAHECV